MSKFKTGDIVIPKYGQFKGVKCRVGSIGGKIYNVESLIPGENRGHSCDGTFDTYRGWHYVEDSLDLAESTESVEETVTIRFLTEQEFKHRGLWSGAFGCPLGWVPVMNKYLEQTINIPLSKIGNDGSFRYEGWDFIKKEYEIVTPSTKNTVTVPQPKVKSEVESKPEAKFKKGDKIIPNCYPFGDTPCEVIKDLDDDGDYRLRSLRLNENRGDLNDDLAFVLFTSLENATLIIEEPKTEEPESKPKSKFKVGDTVIYNGCVSNLKSKIFTVTHIIFGSEIIYSLKAVDNYFHYDIPESSLEKYNPFESATSVVSTEWIPATKLINSKTKVNLSPELEYHQQPQIIKKPIKKSLITI